MRERVFPASSEAAFRVNVAPIAADMNEARLDTCAQKTLRDEYMLGLDRRSRSPSSSRPSTVAVIPAKARVEAVYEARAAYRSKEKGAKA